MSSIFGKANAAGAAPAAPASGAKPSSSTSAAAPAGSITDVDVAGVLTQLAVEKKEKLDCKRGKSRGSQAVAQRCVTIAGKYGTSGWFGTARREPR